MLCKDEEDARNKAAFADNARPHHAPYHAVRLGPVDELTEAMTRMSNALLGDAADEIERLRAELAAVRRYQAGNPLGGPASMFATAASRIEAGESLDDVLHDYGWCQEAERDRLREGARYMARVWILSDDDPQSLEAVDNCVDGCCVAAETRNREIAALDGAAGGGHDRR